MVNLNRIRSLKTLEDMKRDLTEFINNPIMKELYKENAVDDGGEEQYEDDKEDAAELLEKVEHRMQSLGKFLARDNKEEKEPAAKVESPA